MKNVSVISLFLMVLFALSFSSCEEIDTTYINLYITNNSSVDYIVRFNDFPNGDSLIVTRMRTEEDSGNSSLTLYKSSQDNGSRPKYTKEEFREIVSSLSIYRLSNDGEMIYYGGSETFAQHIDRWKYTYFEDHFWGEETHQYRFNIND